MTVETMRDDERSDVPTATITVVHQANGRVILSLSRPDRLTETREIPPGHQQIVRLRATASGSYIGCATLPVLLLIGIIAAVLA